MNKKTLLQQYTLSNKLYDATESIKYAIGYLEGILEDLEHTIGLTDYHILGNEEHNIDQAEQALQDIENATDYLEEATESFEQFLEEFEEFQEAAKSRAAGASNE